jgi:hypothetical protein
MHRYGRIECMSFGQTALPLPLSVRIGRVADVAPARGQNDAFATSVQMTAPRLTAEVRIRGTAVAEALTPGEQDTLTFTIAPTESGQSGRSVALAGAVLTAVELAYEQAGLATAVLRFVAEADPGTVSPFSAEDAQ